MAKSKRKRKPKQASETKADQVEFRKQPMLALDADQKAKLKRHVETYQHFTDQMETIKGKRTKALEVAIADGFTSKLVKDVHSLKRSDPDEFRNYLVGMAAGADICELPFEISVTDRHYKDEVAQARAEAKAHVKAGKSIECRWPEGSREHDAYLESFRYETSKLVPGADKLSDKQLRDAAAKKPELEAVN